MCSGKVLDITAWDLAAREGPNSEVGLFAVTDTDSLFSVCEMGGLDFVIGGCCFVSSLVIGAVFLLVDNPNVVTYFGLVTGPDGGGLVDVENGGYLGAGVVLWLGFEVGAGVVVGLVIEGGVGIGVDSVLATEGAGGSGAD